MGAKVVSTKLSEEEYGKLVGLCSASGFTVSKILKRAILERMNKEGLKENIPLPKQIIRKESQGVEEYQIKRKITSEDRFLYY